MRTYISKERKKNGKINKYRSVWRSREERQTKEQTNENPGAFTNLTPMAFKGKTGRTRVERIKQKEKEKKMHIAR